MQVYGDIVRVVYGKQNLPLCLEVFCFDLRGIYLVALV